MTCALITGSARRIGRSLALAFAAQGYDIYVHCHRSRDEARAVAGEIEALGRSALVVDADLADPVQALGLMERCTALGPVTCLVNNAALYERDGVADFHPAQFDRLMAVNLRAPLALASRFAAQLPQGGDGVILNLLDFKLAALPAQFISYTASKAGLAAATEMLAVALAPRIRVNAIAPGLVLPSDHEPDDTCERLSTATPLRHGVAVGDIVEAALYLARAASVTGQTIMVDAGQRFVSRRYVS